MKLGRRSERQGNQLGGGRAVTSANHSKKTVALIGVLALTALLIIWVAAMGKKAEETVSVVMWKEPIYKNEAISLDKVVEYKMVKAEFEKYVIANSDGSQTRRIILWDEVNQLVGTFAAYPLQANTLAMISDVVYSRTDNSDTVLYSYPGKVIVSFDLGSGDLNTFKSFIQPGDRVNITAIFKDESDVLTSDSYGNSIEESVETLRQETAFKDIMIADLLNGNGESVLDLFTYYNNLSTYDQAALEGSEDWKSKTTPSTLLVALTPEELTSYYEYLAKSGIEFRMSLPQRTE